MQLHIIVRLFVLFVCLFVCLFDGWCYCGACTVPCKCFHAVIQDPKFNIILYDRAYSTSLVIPGPIIFVDVDFCICFFVVLAFPITYH